MMNEENIRLLYSGRYGIDVVLGGHKREQSWYFTFTACRSLIIMEYKA